MLGFERKARLFCDELRCIAGGQNQKLLLGFERKARLFCDMDRDLIIDNNNLSALLGFERKARLFCDENFKDRHHANRIVGI